ncbi:hypothetical protein N7509_004749 [Penicillium cosmopolitanum]|uniref:DUF2406 domain-containing protein n=1 Tax=Penicillium cosmopolitanum TaxID=1131564 RepID=A0A9W9W146_9EURO|nr:uncharacterized protein N7509_004749 [Penicillium cosmopolitanum]KAJ5396636.1 hypothetical protein N7509_004749 [Penicillium cosmopolitanum]
MAAPPTARFLLSSPKSVKSDNSRRTSTSGNKIHLSESHEEKERRNLHTKADPTVAMNELQPNDIALQKSNLSSLRDIQHKDQFGNLITDPDWSNPTRSRSERPLDTIRSFEAAIYGTYNSTRPVSYARTGSFTSQSTDKPQNPGSCIPIEDAASQMGDYSRRTSYYGGQGGYNRGYDQSNYHSRNQSRPDDLADGNQYNQQENYYPYQQQQQQNGRRRPHVSTDQTNYYQNNNYHQSYDNVTASGSGGSAQTDPYGQSTDPSSMNSSVDQLQQHALLQQQQQQRMDDRAQEYGFSFGNAAPLNTKGFPSAPPPVASPTSPGSVAQQHFAAPANGALRKKAPQTGAAGAGDKRKSWFKRRFSKD